MLSIERTKSNRKLDSLIFLRGIAVIMVCLCHFGGALQQPNIQDVYGFFHEYGKYGVQMFFVISGFVIPLSLYKGKYRLTDYGRFLYKRLLRLQLPYLAGLAITLLVMYVSYRYKHQLFPENLISIILSCFYAHAPANNPVFWTLTVEVQYYFFIGLLFPLLARIKDVAVIFLLLLSVLSQIENLQVVALVQYLPFFFVGTIVYLLYTSQGNLIINILMLASLFVIVYWASNIPAFTISLFTAGVILFYKSSLPKFLHLPGKVSYSVYLIHFPLGIKLLNLCKTKVNQEHYWLLLIITLVLSFVIGWVLYKFLEEPCERWSQRIKYSGKKTSEKSNIALVPNSSIKSQIVQ